MGLAVFVATPIGVAAEGGADAPRTVLKPGVVAIQLAGAAEETFAPLMSDGVVVARSGPERTMIVRCAELARVTTLSCPLPVEAGELGVMQNVSWVGGPVAALFYPRGFAEPGPNVESRPIDTIFVPTDGTGAAEERIRTVVARTMPHALTRTYRDYVADGGVVPQPIDAELYEAAFSGAGSLVPFAMVFVMLVAASSLTVSTVAGMMDRRRPFALLRASGVGLGELRWLALLESAVPLALTVLGGLGAVLLTGYLAAPEAFTLPSYTYFLGLTAAVLTALAVCMISWPLMEVATRHDNVRFE